MKQQIVVLSLGLLLTGCAAIEADEYAVADPYEGFNRGSYAVTDKVDRAVLQPVARGYERITPGWLAGGILNIFENLRSLPSGINCFLQGKPKSGATDLTRLVVNSTIGIGGFYLRNTVWLFCSWVPGSPISSFNRRHIRFRTMSECQAFKARHRANGER